MCDTQQNPTPVRDRTRTAILEAAASTWARNRSATLSEIADAAGVGRSTVHRYFTGREQLLESTIVDSAEVVGRAVEEAHTDLGPAPDALRRLVSALVEAGDRIVFLFDDPEIVRRMKELGYIEQANSPVLDLIRRGQQDGSLDNSLSAEWIQNVIWALVYTGFEKREDGHLFRHDVVPTILRTLYHGILSRDNSH